MSDTMPEKVKSAKPLYLLVAAALVVCLVGLLYFEMGNASASTVAAGDGIEVYYTGTLANGTVFDSNVGGTAFNFTVGANEVIPGFDQGVIGMKLNENRTITIPANEAYGQVNPALIVTAPLAEFTNRTAFKGEIVTGIVDNQTRRGTVIAVNTVAATVNFNSPLAGQTLIFNVKVVAIRGK